MDLTDLRMTVEYEGKLRDLLLVSFEYIFNS